MSRYETLYMKGGLGDRLSEQIIAWREQHRRLSTRHRMNSHHIIQDARIFSLSSEAIALSLPLFCNRNCLVNDRLDAFSLENRTLIAILILSHDFPLAKTSWRPEVADYHVSESSKWETDEVVDLEDLHTGIAGVGGIDDRHEEPQNSWGHARG